MKTKSFTLIELLVVIVIIGILAGVIIVSTSSSINKANFAKAQAFSNTVQQELLLNLVSEWTFDEDPVGTAKDTWGNNDGTVNGATYQNKASGNCVYGGCYSFNGTTDYINREDKILSNVNEITVTVWVRPSKLTGVQTIICQNGPFILDITNNKFSSKNIIHTGSSWVALSGIKPLILNNWTYLVLTYNSSYVKTYINGEFDNSVVKTGVLIGNGKFVVGGFSLGRVLPDKQFFNGLIDDVRIYNAALSTSQIKQEYIAGLNSLLANNSISKEEYDQRLNNLAQK